MTTTILDTWTKVESLAPEWNQLLDESSAPTFFSSWEWLSSWMELVHERTQPLFVTVRDDSGRLCGVAPFYLTKLALLGAVPYRTLRLAADFATGFEYGDWLARSDRQPQVFASIVRELAEHRDQWDVVWMPLVRGWTGGYAAMKEACRSAGFLWHERKKPFGAFPLPESLDAFEQSFSTKRRQQLRRHKRNLMSDTEIKLVRCDDMASLPRFLEALYDLHERRRMLEADRGTFVRKPLQKSFYPSFAAKAFAKGWLRIYALEKAGAIEAIQFGYVYRGAFHQIQEGFNPAFSDGVGNVLRHLVIEELIKEGVKEYDFLGGYTEHKRRWGAEQRDGYDVFMAHPSIKNRLLFSREIWPNGRYMKASGLVEA